MNKSTPIKPVQAEQDPNEQKMTKTTQQRRSLDAPKPTPKPNDEQFFIPSKLDQKSMDSACYRLSRIPQKFNTAKVAKTSGNSSYAQTYYANNPDATVDTRPPKEKLEEIDKKLAGEENEAKEEEEKKEETTEKKEENEEKEAQNKDDERFELLVQQKSLRFLVYGENSPEAVQSMTALGAFYTAHDHPESALRHLNKAQQTAKTTKLSEEDSFKLGLELADANMHAGAHSTSKQDKNKKMDLAEKAIMPYAEYETSDAKLGFRRDLICAEIFNLRKKYEKAVPLYEKAGDNYPSANPEKTKAMGDIYVKGAECAKNAAENPEPKDEKEAKAQKEEEKNPEEEEQKQEVDYAAKAKELYQKAISVYNDLGETKEAEKYKEFVETKEEENPQEAEQNGENADAANPGETPAEANEEKPAEEQN